MMQVSGKVALDKLEELKKRIKEMSSYHSDPANDKCYQVHRVIPIGVQLLVFV